ncbi:ABC transporter ATP-binding protein [Planococcus lenghuensis]|uniref:ABC transporter n=1 Tax=Planococcus lenghuensis TaxID=2213202 RepID=A0A1Q2KYX6_9BACL|nr:ABC transporter ATP-binding protein [Planococcus lenghuensis]AQQ53324.1 ABC transporter [Planococcus lenghuensis]
MPVCEPVISFENVAFRFPDEERNTLQDLSFEVHPGERLVISGVSGSGKSTLLYLLNRLYPDNCDGVLTGHVQLFGKPAATYAPGEICRQTATVLQDPDAQFCMPTVEQELAFTLENLKIGRTEMESTITATLELTGLTPYRHAVIQTLSGGMKQRVALACAIAMQPEVLVLDEPIAHLDPYSAQAFIELLDKLQDTHGWTVIVVEHRLELWEGFFTRELVLNQDGVLQADRPFTAPCSPPFPVKRASALDDIALKAQGVSVSINGIRILQDISLTAAAGEIMVIAGPNGSGKSTLLKALCGIVRIDSGKLTGLTAGYVPQSPEYLFMTQRVADELTYSGCSTAEEIRIIADRLGLRSIWDAHPFAVSHGQKRRVATGAMMADKRQVLLMDEPAAGQDAAALLELAALITEQARSGMTVVIVTHDMAFAAAVADSVLLMKEGRLSRKFLPAELWQEPDVLNAYHLVSPEGAARRAAHFA